MKSRPIIIGTIVAVALILGGVVYSFSNKPSPAELPPQVTPEAESKPSPEPLPPSFEQKIDSLQKAIADVCATGESKEVTMVFSETEANDQAAKLLAQTEIPEDIPLEIESVNIDFQPDNNVLTEARSVIYDRFKVTIKLKTHVSIEEGKLKVEVTSISFGLVPLPEPLKDRIVDLGMQKIDALLTQLAEAGLDCDGKVDLQFMPELTVQRASEPIIMEMHLTGNRIHTKRMDFAKGDPENPMSWEELGDKFRDCVSFSAKPISDANVTKVIELVKNLEDVEDINQIIKELIENPIVSLVSIGGLGKTRIAVEVALRLKDTDLRYHDIGFASLEQVKEDNEHIVLETLTAAFDVDVTGHGGIKEALIAEFKEASALLILDNCETAPDSTAKFVYDLLKACPDLKVFTTTQNPLRIHGVEKEIHLNPMLFPEQTNISLKGLKAMDSFKLFQARSELKEQWKITKENANKIAEILQLTDGIPLAIELVGSWVQVSTPDSLVKDLRERRDEILRNMGSSGIDAERHASMQACLDYTFEHLSESELDFAVALSVFAGGFFREAAEKISEMKETLSMLRRLRERNLLNQTEVLGEPRYFFLPTIKNYLQNTYADKTSPSKKRHAEYYLSLVSKENKGLQGPEPRQAIDRVNIDLDNIRAGMDWAASAGENSIVVYYSFYFNEFLRFLGFYQENVRRAGIALASSQKLKDQELTAACQNNLGIAYNDLPTGDRGENLQQAITCYEAALRVRTERDFPTAWAMTQNNLGNAYGQLPIGDRGENLQRAISCFEAALRVRTERDFPIAWATTQNNLGAAYSELPTGDRGENLQQAIECFEAALRVRTERDIPIWWATTQNNLGAAYGQLPTGDRGQNLQRAISCFEAALRVRTERDFPIAWATTQNNLGNANGQLPTGDRGQNLQRAIACYAAALRVYTERDFPIDWATTQSNLGAAYSELPTGDRGQNLQQAIVCYEAALSVYTEKKFPERWALVNENLDIAMTEKAEIDKQ